jgi:hypothetical protein
MPGDRIELSRSWEFSTPYMYHMDKLESILGPFPRNPEDQPIVVIPVDTVLEVVSFSASTGVRRKRTHLPGRDEGFMKLRLVRLEDPQRQKLLSGVRSQDTSFYCVMKDALGLIYTEVGENNE